MSVRSTPCGAWRARASHFDLVHSPQHVVAAAVANHQYVIRATLHGMRSKNLVVDDVTLNTKAGTCSRVCAVILGDSYLHCAPSSDLWVAGIVKTSKDTGKAAKVQYAVDGVQGTHQLQLYEVSVAVLTPHTTAGSVDTADLEFAGYTITDQAYSQSFAL